MLWTRSSVSIRGIADCQRCQNSTSTPGKWVAVKDRKVVAVADTSRQLMHKIQALGLAGQAVSRYVPPDDDVIVMGVG